ncbi:ABC transporter permease [Clostridium arbusti]|uniref:ABC transporter permease n=1 Tax=Clostridium arbusti TaxID=1137848 RepID=UPI0002886620|nr:ABC transporter permease [Clostridium arbusti]
MNFSIRKTRAIFIKELKEYYRNPYIIFVLLLPLVFSLFYSNLFRDTKIFIPVMNFCINLSIVLLGIQLPSYFILEEKEKKTLDVLILSSVNALEFITGKLLPIIIVSIISNMIVLFLFNTNFECIISLIIITTVNSLIMIVFSTIIALISTNQMHGQLYLILFIIIFFHITFFYFTL